MVVVLMVVVVVVVVLVVTFLTESFQLPYNPKVLF